MFLITQYTSRLPSQKEDQVSFGSNNKNIIAFFDVKKNIITREKNHFYNISD